jgi:hypothetical protein
MKALSSILDQMEAIALVDIDTSQSKLCSLTQTGQQHFKITTLQTLLRSILLQTITLHTLR